MKDKRGQMALGGFILFFISVIVAFALLPSIANGVDTVTNQRTGVDVVYTLPANGGIIDLDGQEIFGTPTVTNTTGDFLIDANYTITEGLSATTGRKTILLTVTGTHYDKDPLSGLSVNINSTFGAEGYAEEAGTRGITNLITIGAALAILGVAAGFAVKEFGNLS